MSLINSLGTPGSLAGSIGGVLPSAATLQIAGSLGGMMGGLPGAIPNPPFASAPMNLAAASATMTSSIANAEKGVKTGTVSSQYLKNLVAIYHEFIAAVTPAAKLMAYQKFQFAQQASSTLSNAQTAMHNAVMQVLQQMK